MGHGHREIRMFFINTCDTQLLVDFIDTFRICSVYFTECCNKSTDIVLYLRAIRGYDIVMLYIEAPTNTP